MKSLFAVIATLIFLCPLEIWASENINHETWYNSWLGRHISEIGIITGSKPQGYLSARSELDSYAGGKIGTYRLDMDNPVGGMYRLSWVRWTDSETHPLGTIPINSFSKEKHFLTSPPTAGTFYHPNCNFVFITDNNGMIKRWEIFVFGENCPKPEGKQKNGTYFVDGLWIES